ncbi:tryptophan-rich sensory protein [Phormidesmis priestleyi]
MQRSGSRDQLLAILTIVAILSAIAINAISNFFPVNGLSIGAISNTIFANVLITPANYAFAIWGVIYLGLIAFGVYQLSLNRRHHSLIQKVRLPIIWASVFQSIWVFQFQLRNYWLSVAFMVGILLSLMVAFLAIQQHQGFLSRSEKWYIQVPFTIYFGWISVATIVNIASALYAVNWDGWGISPAVWTVIMAVIATVISALITIRYHDIAFSGVIIWALVAIAVRQTSQSGIAISMIGLAIALGLLMLFTQIRSQKNR